MTRARSAISDRRGGKAVENLLALWRETRDPEVADTIDAVSARRWLDEPSQLDDVLASLIDGSAAQISERVVRLSALSPDPRIALALVRLIEHPPVTSAVAGPLFTKVFALVAKNEDPRAVERLRALDADASRGEIGKRIRATAPKLAAAMETALRARSRGLAESVRSSLRSLRTELDALEPPKAVRSRAELLAEIYANPDADEPRLVLADVLQEQGDPRGEFIVLQIEAARRELTPKEQKIERGLLRAHGKAWLGPLAKAVQAKDLVFERGFPAVGKAYPPNESLLDAVLDAPEWATFRDLAVGYERMPIAALRHAHVLHLGQTLFRGALDYEGTLRVEDLRAPWIYDFAYLAGAMRDAKSLPLVRALELGHPRPWARETSALATLTALFDVPIVQQLHAFTTTTVGGAEVAHALAAVRSNLPELARFTVYEAGWGQGFSLAFSRSRPGGDFDTLAVRMRSEPRHAEIRERSPEDWLTVIFEAFPATSLRSIVYTADRVRDHDGGAIRRAARHFTSLETLDVGD